ncbi:MAG: hypothetical protein RLZZ76_346 [Candidatus Parcubacteria bacterium]|jgi:hypothetical protein
MEFFPRKRQLESIPQQLLDLYIHAAHDESVSRHAIVIHKKDLESWSHEHLLEYVLAADNQPGLINDPNLVIAFFELLNGDR